MKLPCTIVRATLALLCTAGAWQTAQAADFVAQRQGTYVVQDFKFATGDVLPELKLHYTTVGEPTGEPVLIIHGTTGTGAGLLAPTFGGELFGPGQPLDAARYYVILPDSIGTGRSSKPSDGLRMKFPHYNYDDAVRLQHRLVAEHLGIKHLRMVLGNSMGGMMTWVWAEKYPKFMDIAVPMASLPTEMSGRNWMMRRLLVESIKRDPQWQDGNYTQQPTSFQFATTFFSIGTSGGNGGLYKEAPTRAKADALIDQRLSATPSGDANDHIYQWDSSRDFDASKDLEKIEAAVLAINSADDERNPTELGLLEREMKRVKHSSILLIPGSADTFGHGTTGRAAFWKKEVGELLRTAPRVTP